MAVKGLPRLVAPSTLVGVRCPRSASLKESPPERNLVTLGAGSAGSGIRGSRRRGGKNPTRKA